MIKQAPNLPAVSGIFHRIAAPLLKSEKFKMMDRFTQHGNTSCLKHSLAVAYYSLLMVEKLGLRCDRESLVRGALLHDYFLYDWHDKDRSHSLHGFRHPRTALNNAVRDFELNAVEQDIIHKHMFPLVPLPPRYRESAVVCLVDKMCSTWEIYSSNAYTGMPSFDWEKYD